MKRVIFRVVPFLFALAVMVSTQTLDSRAQSNPGGSVSIPRGAKLYIEPMNGFETYVAAAILKKKVPVTIVNDKDKADFVMTGNAEHIKAGWAKIVFYGQVHSDETASVSVFDAKSGEIAFAYAVDKKNTFHGMQTSAEACAKHLGEAMAHY